MLAHFPLEVWTHGLDAWTFDTWILEKANLGLVKIDVMTNVFFNYHQREIEIKRLICIQ